MMTYKVVMVGDFGVGKTSLVKRFIQNSFSEDYLSTIGVSISKKSINNSTVMLWDIEGHTEFKPIFKQYLLGSKGFIIVADINRKNTVDSIKRHIELCHSITKETPICIALNKSDLPSKVLDKELRELENLSSFVINVSKTSAKNGDGVLDIFNALNKYITQTKE